MAEILLVNPRRRRRKSRRARTRGSVRRRRRSFSVATRRRRRRRTVRLATPRRSRLSRRSVTRMFRRRRRNPSFRGGLGSIRAGVVPTLKAGAIGAAGAIGLDLLWGQTARFLPAQIAASPIAQYAAKLLGALLVGFVGSKVMRGRGRDLAVGATTVVLHDAFKAQLQASFPTLNLGEYLTFAPTVGTVRRADRLFSTGVGEYLSGIPQQEAGEYQGDDMSYSGDYNADGMNGY